VNTVQQTIEGSGNIDRMRKEIEGVIEILHGFLEGSFTGGRDTTRSFLREQVYVFEKYSWRIKYGSFRTPNFDCIKNRLEQSEVKLHFILSGRSRGEDSPVKYWEVQDVYESFVKFIDALLKEYPELMEKFQPLLNASSVYSA